MKVNDDESWPKWFWRNFRHLWPLYAFIAGVIALQQITGIYLP